MRGGGGQGSATPHPHPAQLACVCGGRWVVQGTGWFRVHPLLIHIQLSLLGGGAVGWFRGQGGSGFTSRAASRRSRRHARGSPCAPPPPHTHTHKPAAMVISPRCFYLGLSSCYSPSCPCPHPPPHPPTCSHGHLPQLLPLGLVVEQACDLLRSHQVPQLHGQVKPGGRGAGGGGAVAGGHFRVKDIGGGGRF